MTPARKLDGSRDLTKCIQECAAQNCPGVQVTRVANPAGTLPMVVNIPFRPYRRNESLVIFNVRARAAADPCMIMSTPERTTSRCDSPPDANCDRAKLGTLLPEDSLCFGVSIGVSTRRMSITMTQRILWLTNLSFPLFFDCLSSARSRQTGESITFAARAVGM